MINLTCIFKGHDWANEAGYPKHGWRDEPHKGSYCTRCGKVVA